MMKEPKLIELRFIDLHGPMFLAGTNLGQKLNVKQRTGLKLQHDVNNRWFVVTYNSETALMPEVNAQTWEAVDITDYGYAPSKVFTPHAKVTTAGSSAMTATIANAQVETPYNNPRKHK
jgi:hypothetical protein